MRVQITVILDYPDAEIQPGAKPWPIRNARQQFEQALDLDGRGNGRIDGLLAKVVSLTVEELEN